MSSLLQPDCQDIGLAARSTSLTDWCSITMKSVYWKQEPQATTRREQRKQEIRAKIIEAAIEQFEKVGFEEATLEEICARAGISRPTFYSYYGSKQELIQALAEKLWLNVAKEITNETLSSHRSTRHYIESFFKATRREMSKYGRLERELVRLSMNNETNDQDQNASMLHALNAMFASVYTEGRKRGEIGNRYPIDFLAEVTMGCISSVMMNWAFDSDYPIDRRLKQTMDFILQMLLLEK